MVSMNQSSRFAQEIEIITDWDMQQRQTRHARLSKAWLLKC